MQTQCKSNLNPMRILCKVPSKINANTMQLQLQVNAKALQIQCKTEASSMQFQLNINAHPMQILVPALSVWPLVGISKHRRENSTLLAYNQKPQPQLGPNVQALRRGLRQNLQPWGLAGPPGRPRPKVAISVEVHASVLGHIVPALPAASDWMPAILNFLARAWKFRLAPKKSPMRIQYNGNEKPMPVQCKFNAKSMHK